MNDKVKDKAGKAPKPRQPAKPRAARAQAGAKALLPAEQGLRRPIVSLRDMVVYPHGVQPLFVGTRKSIRALDLAQNVDQQVILVAKRDPGKEDPRAGDLYRHGTLASVLQLIRVPDQTVKILVEGLSRVRINAMSEADGCLYGQAELLERTPIDQGEASVLARSLVRSFRKLASQSRKVPPELAGALASIEDPSRLADMIAAHLNLKLDIKQQLLEMADTRERVAHLLSLLDGELELLKLDKRVRGRVKKQMEKSQREYYLNEQMKALQKELGELDDLPNEAEALDKRLTESGMPKEAREKTAGELKKLRMMSPMSAEATVVRSYIEWMLSAPWQKRSKISGDIKAAETVLEADHYGIKDVKDRILEYLAVQKRVKRIKGPVLCLVGPPGVGKTSLGESIARATGRVYVRMALGGVRDEAEIRGHRRTYIGSLPGKIIQKLARAGVKNPLFLLDEVDKIGQDHRGDPAAALLEVLDPEQNSRFSDHYLEVDYDLSETMFICTSNTMNIPAPLLDRMEIIRIPGYTEDEKRMIAGKYLIPKQRESAGLEDGELDIPDATVTDLIRYYTKEAGVRGLEREIAKLCRKVVKESALAAKPGKRQRIDPKRLPDYAGVRKHNYGKAQEQSKVGLVAGLSVTQVGGDLMAVEAVAVPGKGRITKTGSLGDVMQESIQAAVTVVRSRAHALGIRRNFHEKQDLHIHLPEGGIPKDGPSAGIAVCTAMVSALAGIPAKADLAMTGEITLRGEILPVGGIKEKLLAAHRGGVSQVLIPDENRRDLKEIPDNIKEALDIVPVKWVDEALELALERLPEPLPEPLPKGAPKVAGLAGQPRDEASPRPSAH